MHESVKTKKRLTINDDKGRAKYLFINSLSNCILQQTLCCLCFKKIAYTDQISKGISLAANDLRNQLKT